MDNEIHLYTSSESDSLTSTSYSESTMSHEETEDTDSISPDMALKGEHQAWLLVLGAFLVFTASW